MVRTRSGRSFGPIAAVIPRKPRSKINRRPRTVLLGPIRRNPRQIGSRYARHRPQERIFVLEGAQCKTGYDGYGWHLNPIPQGSAFNQRHSDKIKINSFKFNMQMKDGINGYNSPNVHNVYLALVRDNSSGAAVPKFSEIFAMDNTNVATSVITHDNKDRFSLKRWWKFTFVGGCDKKSPARDRIDFKRTIKIGQDSEFKEAADGTYANTQKNAWVLYFLGQMYDFSIDAHVVVNFTSMV